MDFDDEDERRAQALLVTLRQNWELMPLPQIPPYLQNDMFFSGDYPHVAGKRWDDIDVASRELNHSDWIDYLPAEPRLYYLASFLKYVLLFYCDHWRDYAANYKTDTYYGDADQPYLCMTRIGVDTVGAVAIATPAQRRCVAEIYQFIDDNLPCFGYPENFFPEVAAHVREAVRIWGEGAA